MIRPCKTKEDLETALSNAGAGDLIILIRGHIYSGNFIISRSGTSSAPIVIRSANYYDLFRVGFGFGFRGVLSPFAKATLDGGTPDPTGTDYTLHIKGDYIRVSDLRIMGGKKGIMLDNANHNVISDVQVCNTGEAGVHFRDGSSSNWIEHSSIWNTGTVSPGFGEGVYVGSDVDKWDLHRKEANNNTISYVKIGPDVRAESIDIKEGTTGTKVQYCTFIGTGISGENYADSFMDVKGNHSIIINNIAHRNGNPKIVDAFQVHELKEAKGWGLNNTFYNNTVYLDDSNGYVVNVLSGSARVRDNKRVPAGHLYKGNYVLY